MVGRILEIHYCIRRNLSALCDRAIEAQPRGFWRTQDPGPDLDPDLDYDTRDRWVLYLAEGAYPLRRVGKLQVDARRFLMALTERTPLVQCQRPGGKHPVNAT